MRFVPFVIISVLLCAAAAVMSVVATAHTVKENTLQPANKPTGSTVSSDIATLTDMATRLSGPSSTPGDTAKQLETMRKRLATVAQVAAKNTKRVAQARKVTPKGPASNYSKAKQTGTTYYSVRGKNGQFVKKSLVALNGACETSDNEFGFCLSGADCQRRSRRFVSGPCKDGAVCCLRDTPPARTVTPTDQYTPAENQKCMGNNGRAFDGICMTQTDCTAAGVVGLYSVHTPGVQFCKWSKDAKPADKTKPLLCCQPKREYSAPSPNIKGQKRTKW